jgi:hypothetical protein
MENGTGTHILSAIQTRGAAMNKPVYEKPVVEVMSAEELLEAIGCVECASGGGPRV